MHALQYRSSWLRGAQRAALPRVPSSAGVVCGHASAHRSPPWTPSSGGTTVRRTPLSSPKQPRPRTTCSGRTSALPNPRVQRHRNGRLTTQDDEALVLAPAAVRLEGPAHLANLAHRIELASTAFTAPCWNSSTARTPSPLPRTRSRGAEHLADMVSDAAGRGARRWDSTPRPAASASADASLPPEPPEVGQGTNDLGPVTGVRPSEAERQRHEDDIEASRGVLSRTWPRRSSWMSSSRCTWPAQTEAGRRSVTDFRVPQVRGMVNLDHA